MDNIPEGYCQCGCGLLAPLAPHNDSARGWKKDKPRKYVHGHNSHRSSLPAFEEQDAGYATPCWIGRGSKTSTGYCRPSVNGRKVLLHRFYYEREFGSLSPDTPLHHLCERKDCCNPYHLVAMTPSQHSLEHSRYGEDHPNTYLTLEDARTVKKLLDAGHSQVAVSTQTGIALHIIHDIARKRSWKRI